MRQILVDALLGLVVLCSWLAAAGLFRLPTVFDRLHAVAFVNVTGGAGMILAGALAEGATARLCKLVLIVAANLLAGAAASHAIGQALLRRGER